MRTTKKEFRLLVQDHVLNSIELEEGTGEETTPELLEHIVSQFYREKMLHNKSNQPIVTLFQDWLLGLPSNIHIEYRTHAIHELMKEWFETCGATYQERDNGTDWYYKLFVREFVELCKKNNVEFFRL